MQPFASTLIPPAIPPHPQAPHVGWIKGYPLRTHLELGAYRQAAGSARGHVRNVLAEWGLGDFSEAVTLIVSEMVTNSVIATEKVAWEGGRPPVRLWLLGGSGPSGSGEVMVVVWDAVRELPKPRDADVEDVSGRGLVIVGTLSGRQWDYYLPSGPEGGKITRALIDHPWRDQLSELSRRGRDRGDRSHPPHLLAAPP